MLLGQYNVIGIAIMTGYGDMTQQFWVPWNTTIHIADIGYGDTMMIYIHSMIGKLYHTHSRGSQTFPHWDVNIQHPSTRGL